MNINDGYAIETPPKPVARELLNTQMESFNEEVRKFSLSIITLCGAHGASIGYGGIAITNLSKLFNKIKDIKYPVFMPNTVTQFDVMEAILQNLNEHHKLNVQLVYKLDSGLQLQIKWNKDCSEKLKEIKYDDYSSFF